MVSTRKNGAPASLARFTFRRTSRGFGRTGHRARGWPAPAVPRRAGSRAPASALPADPRPWSGVTTSRCTCRLPEPVPRSRGMPCPRSVVTVPDWVPGWMSRSSTDCSVCSAIEVPKAAAVIGRCTVQCRSMPSLVNFSCCSSWTSTYRSPGAPPPGPTSPWPDSRTRMPSPTPAGMLARTLRRVRTRPSPLHCRHGSGMTSPNPRQTGHGREVMT